MNQPPQNRRARRENVGGVSDIKYSEMDLPGPLKFLGNPKLFMVVAAIAGLTMVLGLLFGALSSTKNTNSAGPQQMNEAPDVPIGTSGASGASGATGATGASGATAKIKRYTAPPPMTIDTSKSYVATIKTDKGDITVQLYADKAPQTVNDFVFLANDGYYNGTPFMELVANSDGSKFTAQAGDPTQTGYGTPGYSIPKEDTGLPFDQGAVGMGGTAANSNGGQFFISFGDYPSLNGKYTIFGKITSGMDVLNQLSLLNLTGNSDGGGPPPDTIQSITISSS